LNACQKSRSGDPGAAFPIYTRQEQTCANTHPPPDPMEPNDLGFGMHVDADFNQHDAINDQSVLSHEKPPFRARL
jgi:hypothetical protein